MADSDHIKEQWRPIPGYEGIYEVSNLGRVASLPRRGVPVRRQLTPRSMKSGHLVVCLCKEGTQRNFLVHQLVLMSFVGPCPEGMECCHFPDRNPANNRLSNLRWDTRQNNQADMIFHGTRPKGDTHKMARYTKADFNRVHKLLRSGHRQKDIASLLGMNTGTVSRIVTGKQRVSMTTIEPTRKGDKHHSAKFHAGDFSRVFDLRTMGCTQQVIADWLGMSNGYVCRVLSGNHRIS